MTNLNNLPLDFLADSAYPETAFEPEKPQKCEYEKPLKAADPAEFTSAEKIALFSLLERCMGTEPLDSSWDLSIDDYLRRIIWCAEYRVSGYNYCAEDEYSVSVTFTIEQGPAPKAGFERFDENSRISYTCGADSYISKLHELILHLRTDSKAVWIKNSGAHQLAGNPLVYFYIDLELIFEDFLPGGRNIHLHYCDSSESPF